MDPPNKLNIWYRTERSQEGQNHTGDPPSIDNTVTPMQLEAPELSGSSTNRHVWLTWPSWGDIHRHLHAIAITGAYHLHKGFRRVIPRRLLPAFTSMTLFELYVGFGLATTAERATRTFIDVVHTDPDLLTIEISAIQYSVFSPNMRASLRQLQESEPEWSNALRQWRSASYNAEHNWIDKLRWWQKHVWSDEEDWKCAATAWRMYHALLEPGLQLEPYDILDFEICITHWSNTANCKLSRLCRETGHPRWYDFRDHVHIPLAALVASVPFAMLARRSGIRYLYWPLNGLQRILVGTTLYFGVAQRYQHYSYLHDLCNKKRMAQLLLRRPQSPPGPTP